MRKIFIATLLLAILSISLVNAQTSAGNMMIGGGISLSSESIEDNDDYENKETTFTPGFGYFISDNLAIGANLSISSRTTDTGASKTVTKGFLIAPFVRYYKFTSNENFAFFGQASIGIGSGKVDNTPGGETKTSTFRFALSPGFSYFFNEHWALDMALQGFVINSFDPNKDNDDDKRTTIVFNVNSLSPTFGIRYHFGGN